MNLEELTNYIEDYFENDKTHTAIMLNGEWGVGKSYYVNEVLSKKIPCIIVSLYGLSDLYEVSRSLYVESRLKKFEKNSEVVEVGKIATKTILKGIFSFTGINLGIDENDFKKVFESLDLTNKLIVFEDIERTNIDIVEFFGYVNNLVERDRVKVLLVTNEKEIIKYELVEGKDKKTNKNSKSFLEEHSTNRKYTNKAEEYLKIKEKTVSDTIIFEGDFKKSIQSIISMFDDEILNTVIKNDKAILEIHSIFDFKNCYNLRTLIFACQKAINLYKKLNDRQRNNFEFVKAIFYAILNDSIDIKQGNIDKFGPENCISIQSKEYPLFKFCYDYINNHCINIDDIEYEEKNYNNFCEFKTDKSLFDSDLQVLSSFEVYREADVVKSLENLTNHLEDESHFSFNVYGKIAVSLLKIHYYLYYDIEHAKQLLISNLYNKEEQLNEYYLSHMFLEFQNLKNIPSLYEEAMELMKNMQKSIKARKQTFLNFDYNPNSISSFHSEINELKALILKSGSFLKNLNINKIIEMLKMSSSQQIQEFRNCFASIYLETNVNDYLDKNEENIEKLLQKVIELKNFEKYDKIQKLQIKLFCEDLKLFQNKLKRG